MFKRKRGVMIFILLLGLSQILFMSVQGFGEQQNWTSKIEQLETSSNNYLSQQQKNLEIFGKSICHSAAHPEEVNQR